MTLTVGKTICESPPTHRVIEVEAASQSEENSVHSNSVSTLRANLSMLREAGVTSISCGSANIRSETYALNFSISELSWGGGGGSYAASSTGNIHMLIDLNVGVEI